MSFNLFHFISESNDIEGNFRPAHAAEITAHETLLGLEKITIQTSKPSCPAFNRMQFCAIDRD